MLLKIRNFYIIRFWAHKLWSTNFGTIFIESSRLYNSRLIIKWEQSFHFPYFQRADYFSIQNQYIIWKIVIPLIKKLSNVMFEHEYSPIFFNWGFFCNSIFWRLMHSLKDDSYNFVTWDVIEIDLIEEWLNADRSINQIFENYLT